MNRLCTAPFSSTQQGLQGWVYVSARVPMLPASLFGDGFAYRQGMGEEATAAFERCIELNTEWPQLQHLCMYELAWSHMARRDWGESVRLWEVLEKRSQWSPAFYKYMKALCMLRETGDVGSVATEMGMIPSLVTRKFSGKYLPIEAYVMRKIEDYNLSTKRGLKSRGGRLAFMEIMYLWNMISIMSTEGLEVAEKELLNLTLDRTRGALDDDVEMSRKLILGQVYMYTNQYLQALKLFQSAASSTNIRCDFLSCGRPLHIMPCIPRLVTNPRWHPIPSRENWISPHANFEIGNLLLLSVATLKASHRFANLATEMLEVSWWQVTHWGFGWGCVRGGAKYLGWTTMPLTCPHLLHRADRVLILTGSLYPSVLSNWWSLSRETTILKSGYGSKIRCGSQVESGGNLIVLM